MDRGPVLAFISPSHPAGPWTSDDALVRVQRSATNGTRDVAAVNDGCGVPVIRDEPCG